MKRNQYPIAVKIFILITVLTLFIPYISAEIDNAEEKPADTQKVEQTDSLTKMKAEEATIDSDSSLFSTVKQGGTMMIFIVALALFALTIIVERSIFFLKTGVYSRKKLQNYIDQKTANSSAKYKEELEDELQTEVQIYANRMEKGLPLLNGIGNIAPILGFLGTVVGMIDAFAAIAAATTVNAKVVAVGIQVALVTTAGGLAVAAPALTIYHFFVHLIQRIYSRGEEIISEKSKDLPRLSSSE